MPCPHSVKTASLLQGDIIYAPPPPPFVAIGRFSGEGAGGAHLEAPRGRNFRRPPFFIRPHRSLISGVGGWACIRSWPCIFSDFCFVPSPSPRLTSMGGVSDALRCTVLRWEAACASHSPRLAALGSVYPRKTCGQLQLYYVFCC